MVNMWTSHPPFPIPAILPLPFLPSPSSVPFLVCKIHNRIPSSVAPVATVSPIRIVPEVRRMSSTFFDDGDVVLVEDDDDDGVDEDEEEEVVCCCRLCGSC